MDAMEDDAAAQPSRQPDSPVEEKAGELYGEQPSATDEAPLSDTHGSGALIEGELVLDIHSVSGCQPSAESAAASSTRAAAAAAPAMDAGSASQDDGVERSRPSQALAAPAQPIMWQPFFAQRQQQQPKQQVEYRQNHTAQYHYHAQRCAGMQAEDAVSFEAQLLASCMSHGISSDHPELQQHQQEQQLSDHLLHSQQPQPQEEQQQQLSDHLLHGQQQPQEQQQAAAGQVIRPAGGPRLPGELEPASPRHEAGSRLAACEGLTCSTAAAVEDAAGSSSASAGSRSALQPDQAEFFHASCRAPSTSSLDCNRHATAIHSHGSGLHDAIHHGRARDGSSGRADASDAIRSSNSAGASSAGGSSASGRPPQPAAALVARQPALAAVAAAAAVPLSPLARGGPLVPTAASRARAASTAALPRVAEAADPARAAALVVATAEEAAASGAWEIEFDDLDIGLMIGEGGFGQVGCGRRETAAPHAWRHHWRLQPPSCSRRSCTRACPCPACRFSTQCIAAELWP